MEAKKAPSSKRKAEDTNAANKQAEDPFYSYKYAYTTFDQMKEQGEYNFYGIIYDASFPKEEENFALLPGTKAPLPKYSVVLKLLDQNTNCLTHPNNLAENLITLIIQVNERENIPYVHQIGDIIRVHRGMYVPKQKRNVYLNLLKGNQFKGSWCIFAANPENDGDKPLSLRQRPDWLQNRKPPGGRHTRLYVCTPCFDSLDSHPSTVCSGGSGTSAYSYTMSSAHSLCRTFSQAKVTPPENAQRWNLSILWSLRSRHFCLPQPSIPMSCRTTLSSVMGQKLHYGKLQKQSLPKPIIAEITFSYFLFLNIYTLTFWI